MIGQIQSDHVQLHQGCRAYFKRGFKWIGIILIALMLLGMGYQSTVIELDKRTYTPQGEFYTVNGHAMHLFCMGEGSPTVILEAGGSAEALWWHRVQPQIAEYTRVCAYDRPGMGWSEQTSQSRNPITIVDELHMLLEASQISVPYK